MSFSKYLICLVFISNNVFAQTANEFILQYNKHIDPKNRLDSITKIEFQMSSNIVFKSDFNSIQKNVQSIRNCNYFSDGRCICDYNNTLGQSFSEPLSIPEEDGGNAVKIHLNIISTHKERSFKFITQNDSIVVIEMTNSSKAIHQYTFSSNTKDLLQIKRIYPVNGKLLEAVTTILSYVLIDGIIVPQKARYYNNNSIVEIECSNQKFEYKNVISNKY